MSKVRGEALSRRMPHPTGRDEGLALTWSALTTIVRRVRLPEVHERVMVGIDVPLDRGLYVVLNRLWEGGPMRLSALAEVLHSDLSTVSRQIRRLESLGLVNRSTDEHDGRAVALEASDLGGRVVRAWADAWVTAIGYVVDEWSEREVLRLAALLVRFADDLVLLQEYERSAIDS